jgi:hypothetical protein
MDRGIMGFSRRNSSQRLKDNIPLKLMLAGASIFILIGLIQAIAPALLSGMLGIPVMIIFIFLSIALFASIMSSPRASTTAEKQKRALDGLDMYSMIDRLVDDLDEDELAHLRRRLEERDQGHDPKLKQSLQALLEERSEARQTQQQ